MSRMQRIRKAGCACLCAALLFFCLFPAAAAGKPDTRALEREITAIFDARRAQSGCKGTLLDSDGFLRKSKTGTAADSSPYTDWIAFAMGRFSVVNTKGVPLFFYDDAQAAYLAGLNVYVTEAYAQNGGVLSKTKVTEGQRCVLTAAALGGDPRRLGTEGGRPIDLLADCTFDSTLNVTRQGLPGVIFALIAEHACGAKTPANAKYPDAALYTFLLERELPSGGWTLFGESADPDLTAMALCALEPKAGDKTAFSVTRSADGKTLSTTLGAAVDRGLKALSKLQQSDGGFTMAGVPTCESCAQVLTALSVCGVDAETDKRFLKHGNSVLDALRSYRLNDGGFAHSKTENGGDFDLMATDQAACALVAHWRFVGGLRGLYDVRPDLSAPLLSSFQTVLRALKKALLPVKLFM